MSDSERDRRDLDAAAAASGMSVTRVEIRANGDGTSQALAIGPDPTASPRAVAALFVLSVVEPAMVGVVGGGTALIGIGLIATATATGSSEPTACASEAASTWER